MISSSHHLHSINVCSSSPPGSVISSLHPTIYIVHCLQFITTRLGDQLIPPFTWYIVCSLSPPGQVISSSQHSHGILPGQVISISQHFQIYKLLRHQDHCFSLSSNDNDDNSDPSIHLFLSSVAVFCMLLVHLAAEMSIVPCMFLDNLLFVFDCSDVHCCIFWCVIISRNVDKYRTQNSLFDLIHSHFCYNNTI